MSAEMNAHALDDLAAQRRWVAWRVEERGGKSTKVPYSASGRFAKADDPSTWDTYEYCEVKAKSFGGGVGIQLGDLGGDLYLAGADLDSCITNGILASWARQILDAIPSYAEISPSGGGLKAFLYIETDHVRPFLELNGILDPKQWGFSRSIPGERSKKNHGPGIELYTSNRYFAVTGQLWAGQPDKITLLDWPALERLAALIPPAETNTSGSGGTSKGRSSSDNSRSAMAMRKGAALWRAGKTFEEMSEALRADPETADWVREKGDINGQRELHRIWEKVEESSNATSPKLALKLKHLEIGSDVEIAERVAKDLSEEFGDVVFTDGAFYYFTVTHWTAIADYHLRCRVHLYDGAEYTTPKGDPAAVKLSKSRVSSVINEMGAKLWQPNFFALAPVGINCASGFIAFAQDGSPQLHPHHCDQRCRHVLSGRWAPGAADEPPNASLLEKLLSGIFHGDADADQKIKLLGETAGSAATGHGIKLRRPKAMVFEGPLAENGKSQVLDAIRGALPESAVSAIPPSKLSDDRFVVHLAGKLLNAVDEASKAIGSEEFKKAITGEPMSGRDVFRSSVEFRPVAQHVYTCNALPKFSGGMDRGVRRRLRVVQFNRVIPDNERIENIGLRIAEEEPDILLAWIVGGASRIIQQREFTNPPSSEAALQRWIKTDPVVAWAEVRVEIPKPIEGLNPPAVKSGYAHTRFREWALARGFHANEIPSINSFIQRLRTHRPDIALKHRNSGNWLLGLRILDKDPADDESDNVDEQPETATENVYDFNSVRALR